MSVAPSKSALQTENTDARTALCWLRDSPIKRKALSREAGTRLGRKPGRCVDACMTDERSYPNQAPP